MEEKKRRQKPFRTKIGIYREIEDIDYFSTSIDALTFDKAQKEKQKIENEWNNYIAEYPSFKQFNFNAKIIKDLDGYRVYSNNTVHNTNEFERCISPHLKVRESVDPQLCSTLIKKKAEK